MASCLDLQMETTRCCASSSESDIGKSLDGTQALLGKPEIQGSIEVAPISGQVREIHLQGADLNLPAGNTGIAGELRCSALRQRGVVQRKQGLALAADDSHRTVTTRHGHRFAQP